MTEWRNIPSCIQNALELVQEEIYEIQKQKNEGNSILNNKFESIKF